MSEPSPTPETTTLLLKLPSLPSLCNHSANSLCVLISVILFNSEGTNSVLLDGLSSG